MSLNMYIPKSQNTVQMRKSPNCGIKLLKNTALSTINSSNLVPRLHDVRRLHVDVAERAVLCAQDELGADDVRRQLLLHHPDVVVAAAAGHLLHLARLHVAVPSIRL